MRRQEQGKSEEDAHYEVPLCQQDQGGSFFEVLAVFWRLRAAVAA